MDSRTYMFDHECTDDEWNDPNIPHVVMTGDDEWDPG
jgi:hypothetical protein